MQADQVFSKLAQRFRHDYSQTTLLGLGLTRVQSSQHLIGPRRSLMTRLPQF